MVSGSAIATLVLFVVSIILVIRPVEIPIPFLARKRSFPLNLTTAPIIIIAILWAAQCLGPTEIRHGIVGTNGVKPYNILILFFSLAYMAITLDITGILQAAAFWVRNKGGSHGYKLFIYFYIMLTALSVVIGNDPVILSGTAFLVYYTNVTQLNPTAWLMSEFAAANTASMVLFVGNPTNVVVCEGFSVNNAAFTAYTIFPFLGCSITCLFALGFQFRGSKYIPRHLQKSENLDVRSVLRDPVSAWVGSFQLGTCLVVIIVVSFFHIDVWMISLPFAVAKFIYDIGWDHYCYVKRIHMHSRPKRKASDEPELPAAEVEVRYNEERALTNQTLVGEFQLSQANTSDEPSSSIPTHHDSIMPNHIAHFQTFVAKPMDSSSSYSIRYKKLASHFPTFFTALPRLPFALVPFAFSQFILIEALTHQGWIDIFATWLVRASHRKMFPVIWLVGVLGVILCSISGTNIGATILLTKVVRAAALTDNSNRAAAIALAVASNIGAVSFTFSASLAGLLWTQILRQKGVDVITQARFAYWNLLPLLVMTVVGLGIVCAEMAVLYPNSAS